MRYRNSHHKRLALLISSFGLLILIIPKTINAQNADTINCDQSLYDIEMPQTIPVSDLNLGGLLSTERKIQALRFDRPQTAKDQTRVIAADALLKERKRALLEQWQRNPAAARRQGLQSSERKQLQSISHNCMEEDISLTGEIELLIAEHFHHDYHQDVYQIKTNNGHVYRLHHEDNPAKQFQTGERVRAYGQKLDSHILLNKENAVIALPNPPNTSSSSPPPSGGDEVAMFTNRRIAVILANFSNTTQPSLSSNQVINVSNDVRNYYEETTFGDITTSGVLNPGDPVDVYGWITLPFAQTCDYNTVFSQATSIAGVSTFTYDSVVIVAPFSCSWLGLATIGGGRMWIQASAYNLLVTGHELGHNLGLHHAGFLDCDNSTITTNRTGCGVSEYGDRYEIMGNIHAGHLNAPHKERLGLLQNNNIVDVQNSGLYVIKPIEISPNVGDLLALKIQRTASDWLYLEFRQPIGYDNVFGTNADVYTGAIMHVLDGSNAKPLLLDMTPPGSNAAQALHVGDTFTDPETGHSVEVVSRTDGANGELVVNVTLAGNPVLYGDVDLNGSVTSIDASLAARFSVQLITLTPEQITAADVNGSSDVTSIDASLIARYAVGLITIFPVEE